MPAPVATTSIMASPKSSCLRRISIDIVASAPCTRSIGAAGPYHVHVASFSAFIFDMDGVIINSTAIHTKAWIRYLRQHGIDLPDVGARMLGKHNDEIVREFFGSHDLSREDVFRHGARKEALYRELIAPVFEENIVPGIRDFLERANQAGVPVAVATNAERGNLDFVLERADIRKYFRTVAS